MLEEIIKSAQSHINERLSSPLMGSFVVSWSLWNYKFFVILFSSATVTQTFKMIDAYIFPNSWTLMLRGVLFPVLTATAYIFLYPYPAKFVYGFTRRRQKEINDLRQKIEDETPLTLEESRTIRAEVTRIENEHSQEIDRKNREIDRLKNEIKEHQSLQTAIVPSVTEQSSVTVEPSQMAILRLVEKLQGKALEKVLINQSGDAQIKTEYDLGELVRKELLTRRYHSPNRDHIYEFTHAGRTYLVTHKDTNSSEKPT